MIFYDALLNGLIKSDSTNMSTEENVISLAGSENTLPEVEFSRPSQTQLAWDDFVDGLQKWRVWSMLAYQDIVLRYRRSVLGPLWLTISMAITIYSMGFLYARLMRTELSLYYPFLVGGILSWSLISQIILEATDTLIFSETLIKQIKLPYTLYIHRIVTKNIIIFAHNILVLIPIYIIFHDSVKINLNTLYIIPGLVATYIAGTTYGLLLAMLGARFRDISQVIKSMVQVIFFITPVIWQPSAISAKSQWIVDFNPLYGFIECIREPLLGNAPQANNILSVVIVTLVGILITSKFFTRYRSRIVYWL